MARRRSVEEQLDALVERCRQEDDASLGEVLEDALRKGPSLVAARAAREVGERSLSLLTSALVTCLRRFLDDPVRTDPGCHAKEAALEALAVLEHPEIDPFLEAAAHVQKEPAWGPPVDTATTLRARAVTALAALAVPDFLVLAGDMLGDPEVPVRLATADAVAHHGAPDGAGLLLLAVRRGDDDPGVLASCLAGALRLAPEWALPRARALLAAPEAESRDAAAQALGESGLDAAVDVLLDRLEDLPLSDERPPLLRALAFHRSARALEAVAEVVADGSLADGQVLLKALAPRWEEAPVRDAVRESVERSGREELEALAAELTAE